MRLMTLRQASKVYFAPKELLATNNSQGANVKFKKSGETFKEIQDYSRNARYC